MPTVLILCAHRPKRSPSQRYRFEQYLPFLESKGYHFTYSYLLDARDDKVFYSQGKFLHKAWILLKSVFIRFRDGLRFHEFDIIFIQREASFFGTSLFEKWAFTSGDYVIFDFDDSIWLADTSPGNKKWEWIKRPEKFFRNLIYAHAAIAGNSYLAHKAKPYRPNVVVIPTTIDTTWHVPKPELRNGAVITIGWSGSISTIKHFELIVPVLIQLKSRFGEKIRFKIIGDAGYKCSELPVEAVAWTEATEVDELNTLDIGIMPLPDDEWAKGKCGLKGLSYMACGISAVLSNVGVNKDIIADGENGFLALTPEEWFTKLCQLIVDPALREKLGEAGRRTVESKYSVIANKYLYLEVFKEADPLR